VLLAELVAHYFPKMVELHNYRCGAARRRAQRAPGPAHAAAPSVALCLTALTRSAANGMQQKLYNWNTLNLKVLKKLGAQLSKAHMQDIANGVPGAIERALKLAKVKIAAYQDDGPPRCGLLGAAALTAAGAAAGCWACAWPSSAGLRSRQRAIRPGCLPQRRADAAARLVHPRGRAAA
jgi:hypothetical protein